MSIEPKNRKLSEIITEWSEMTITDKSLPKVISIRKELAVKYFQVAHDAAKDAMNHFASDDYGELAGIYNGKLRILEGVAQVLASMQQSIIFLQQRQES